MKEENIFWDFYAQTMQIQFDNTSMKIQNSRAVRL